MSRRTGPPDCIGIGTYLAGTEWWTRKLLQHPQLAGPRGRKDLYFFEPFCAREMTDADVAAYHAKFKRGDGQFAFEFSNRYSYDVWTLPLIKRAAPDAKLLMILRDPVGIYHRSLEYRRGKRARWHKWRERDKPIYMAEEIHRGRFGTQMRQLMEFFAPESLLVLQLEAMLRDPHAEFRKTLQFLGVDETFVPKGFDRPKRTDDSPVELAQLLRAFGLPASVNLQWLRRILSRPVPVPSTLWPDIEQALRDELDDEIRELLTYRPELDMTLWPFFSHLGVT